MTGKIEWIKWTKKSSKIEYGTAGPGRGGGEHKFAAEIGGERVGGEYDVLGPDGLRYEVKSLTSGGFMGHMTPELRRIKRRVIRMAWDLQEAFEGHDSDSLWMLHPDFKKFTEELPLMVRRLESRVGPGGLLGDLVKGTRIKWGMFQFLDLISQVSMPLDIYLRLEECRRKEPAFADSSELLRIWEEMPAPSHSLLAKADRLVLVHPEHGYSVMGKKKVNRFVKMKQIGEAKPDFTLKKGAL